MEQKIYVVTVRFSPVWIRRWVGGETSPADWVLKRLKERYAVSDVSMKIDFIRCKVPLADQGAAETMLREITAMLSAHFGLAEDANVVEVSIVPETPEGQPDTASGGATTALLRIRSLIGAPQFKELAEECITVAAGIKEYKLLDVFLRRAYLVSVNDGCGLTTYLRAFAELIRSLGLFVTNASGETVLERRMPLPATNEPSVESAVRHLSIDFSKIKQQVFCIDISDWMDRLSDPVFRGVLRNIHASAPDCILFFRVPFVEQQVLERIRAQIAEVLMVRAFSIAPFSPEELRRYAEQMLVKRHFSVAPEAWALFDARISTEKNNGRFYGIDTVENVVREMLYLKLLGNARSGAADTVIRREDVAGLVKDDQFSEAPGMEQLDALVGVESIRDRVLELLAQIGAAAKSTGPERPGIHMRFVGAPGTGKTTVARIMGRILAERGVLRTGGFYEHAGRDFCGQYVGQTAPKTAAICRDAYGGVLFVDEAYSLFRAGNEDTPDFGREAIDTLIAEMENHRSDLLVIFAGYPDEMEKLLDSNPGLKSRMPYEIEFPNYTREQLAEIFFRFAKKNFAFDAAFSDAVRAYFSSLSSDVVESKEFGNARFVRNLYERTWGKAALRCQLNDLPCDTLTVEDFTLACAEKEFQEAAEKKKIGF